MAASTTVRPTQYDQNVRLYSSMSNVMHLQMTLQMALPKHNPGTPGNLQIGHQPASPSSSIRAASASSDCWMTLS
jgi:hypothetical protein